MQLKLFFYLVKCIPACTCKRITGVERRRSIFYSRTIKYRTMFLHADFVHQTETKAEIVIDSTSLRDGCFVICRNTKPKAGVTGLTVFFLLFYILKFPTSMNINCVPRMREIFDYISHSQLL